LLPFATGSPTVRAVVLFISVAKCVECMSDVIAGLLQREERLDRAATSLILRGAAAALTFSLAYFYFHSLVLSAAGMAGAWMAVLVLYDLPNARALLKAGDGFFWFDPQALRKLLRLSLPLGWVATIGSLTLNIPRYILQHDMGLADQGIFASLAYLIVAINMVILALTQSVTTRLSCMYAEGDLKRFRQLLTKLSMLGILITVAGVPLAFMVGRPLLSLLYRPEYGNHVGLFALLVGTAGVSTIGSFLFCGASAARSFRVQVPVYLVAMIIGALGSAILIPRVGLIGAGIALLLSAMTVVLGGLWVMDNILKRRCD
jgi:O-antigen/teichoic acid export membrane protein